MIRRAVLAALLLAPLAAAPPPLDPGPPAAFADLAALTIASPVIVTATIAKAARLGAADAPGVAPGSTRLLVRARLSAALRAPAAIPADIDYLIDVPAATRLKGLAVLLFLRPGARDGQFALTASGAQQNATPAAEASVRALLAELALDKAPVVTGVGSAFTVPGAIAGEAESQFFLTTQSGKPVSLVVLTRPGEAKSLRLALGDVIDDAAAPVRPGTLLWYRLACFLPRALPGAPEAALAADYAFVLATLGPCERRL